MQLACAVLVKGGDVEFLWAKSEPFEALVALLASLASSSAGATPFSAALDIGSATFVPIGPSRVLVTLFCHGELQLESTALRLSSTILFEAITMVFGPSLCFGSAPFPAEAGARLSSLCARFSEAIELNFSPVEFLHFPKSAFASDEECSARSFASRAAFSALPSEAANSACGHSVQSPQSSSKALTLYLMAGIPQVSTRN